MAQTAPQRSSRDEAAALGKAIKNLRESMGLSQEELAGRMGVERQTISRYETGRPVILRTDLQRQVVEALGVSVQALMDERDNIVFPDFRATGPAIAADAVRAQLDAGARTTVRVHAQPEIREDGEIHYAEVRALSSEDLGWMFGPNAGYIRLADNALPGVATGMRFAGYDKSVWPRPGQGCVIETRDGELLPRIYERRGAAGLQVTGGDEGESHTVPAARVKGVYAIRVYGD